MFDCHFYERRCFDLDREPWGAEERRQQPESNEQEHEEKEFFEVVRYGAGNTVLKPLDHLAPVAAGLVTPLIPSTSTPLRGVLNRFAPSGHIWVFPSWNRDTNANKDPSNPYGCRLDVHKATGRKCFFQFIPASLEGAGQCQEQALASYARSLKSFVFP